MSCGNPWRWSLLSSHPPSSSTLLSQRRTPRFHIAGIRTLLLNRATAIKPPIPNKTLTLPALLRYGSLLASVFLVPPSSFNFLCSIANQRSCSNLQYWIQIAAPAAMAVTGDNNVEEDLVVTLVTGGIAAVVYLLVFPPIILNWLRLRWYKRRFLEMYFQFMFVFIFFPGLMLWAPFVNFRPLPRDPTMKYPWSTPKDDVQPYKSR